jgi:hypothetical protein
LRATRKCCRDRSERRVGVAPNPSALYTLRLDPVDGFIDTVIAWENLFGSRDREQLTLSISGAMARLLQPLDFERRLELQRELRDRYYRRSAIVHGGTHLEATAATVERDNALAALLATLRVLYRGQPHLIPDTNRARKILLA